LYDNPAVARPARQWQRLYLALGSRRLRRRLLELAPDAVVCTSAAPMAALALAKKKLGLAWPLIAVVTDYRAHGYWLSPPAELYLVATEEAAASLLVRGAAEGHVRAAGIPIDPAFSRPMEARQAREALGLQAQSPVLLLTGGSHGLGRLRDAADAALSRLPGAQLLALCGANGALRRQLERRYGRKPQVRVFPDLAAAQVRELMGACDLVVGKAGGVTVAEALALGRPLVIFEPLPGQEARNTEFLVAQGVAVKARNKRHLGRLLPNVLRPEVLAPMRRRALALGRPDAADRALDAVLSLLPRV
jgi:processive 1,2-diacylglycerol beta-glucosyltransferase